MIPAWTDIQIVVNQNGVVEWNVPVGNSIAFDNNFLDKQDQKQIEGMGLWDIENLGVLKLNTPY